MKDFYNNNKKLCLIIAALLLFALCRIAIYDRRYYVSKNRYVVINRVTGSCVWCNAEYKDKCWVIRKIEYMMMSNEEKEKRKKYVETYNPIEEALKYANGY